MQFNFHILLCVDPFDISSENLLLCLPFPDYYHTVILRPFQVALKAFLFTEHCVPGAHNTLNEYVQFCSELFIRWLVVLFILGTILSC